MRPSSFSAPAPATYAPDLSTADAAGDATGEVGRAIRCTNCGSDGCEAYCPRCGQETHGLHRSLVGILGEMLDVFAGWDGKIPQTLWLLVRRPGGLTREFLGGRRVRYLRPLRLYLMMSVLFFVSLSYVQTPAAVQRARSRSISRLEQRALPAAQGRTALTDADGVVRGDSAFNAFLARHRNDRGTGPTAWLKRHFAASAARLQTLTPVEQRRVLKEAFFAHAPNMLFLLLPVFALLLRLFYLRTPVFYAEHFVFALHNHAFAFLALTTAHVASVWLRPLDLGTMAALPLCWMPVYFFVSMRRVYGGSRRRTAAKFVVLSATYLTILLVAVMATALVSLVTLDR